MIGRMRSRLLIGAAMLLSARVLGQGTVNFSNLGLANSFVYVGAPASTTKAPVGTTFSVALYWAPVDAPNPSIQPAPSTFKQEGPSGFIAPLDGLYSVGVVTIPGIAPPGGLAWLQVRAWETACGSTFEQAGGIDGGLTGVSSIIGITTGDPTTGGSPARLTGVGPVYIADGVGPGIIDPCVPEPSTVLLAFLGMVVVLGVSRQKRSG